MSLKLYRPHPSLQISVAVGRSLPHCNTAQATLLRTSSLPERSNSTNRGRPPSARNCWKRKPLLSLKFSVAILFLSLSGRTALGKWHKSIWKGWLLMMMRVKMYCNTESLSRKHEEWLTFSSLAWIRIPLKCYSNMEWLSIFKLAYVPNVFIPQFMHFYKQITTHAPW